MYTCIKVYKHKHFNQGTKVQPLAQYANVVTILCTHRCRKRFKVEVVMSIIAPEVKIFNHAHVSFKTHPYLS